MPTQEIQDVFSNAVSMLESRRFHIRFVKNPEIFMEVDGKSVFIDREAMHENYAESGFYGLESDYHTATAAFLIALNDWDRETRRLAEQGDAERDSAGLVHLHAAETHDPAEERRARELLRTAWDTRQMARERCRVAARSYLPADVGSGVAEALDFVIDTDRRECDPASLTDEAMDHELGYLMWRATQLRAIVASPLNPFAMVTNAVYGIRNLARRNHG